MVSITAALADATSHREGNAGVRWLNELPSLIDRFLHEWDCEVVGEAWHGETAIVLPMQRDADVAVLKFSFPHPGNRGEAPALRHLGGRGAVRLLGMPVLNHLPPGATVPPPRLGVVAPVVNVRGLSTGVPGVGP